MNGVIIHRVGVMPDADADAAADDVGGGRSYADTNGHWAESSIERWSAYGIIQGSNGQFDPNGQLTCARLATILAEPLLKLPAAKDAGFTDNTADAWYYDAIQPLRGCQHPQR